MRLPKTIALAVAAGLEHTFGLAPLAADDAHVYAFGNAFGSSQTLLGPVRAVTRPLPYWPST
jgi:hypothetical protein